MSVDGDNLNPEVDVDPQETEEWLESLRQVVAVHGPERARFLLDRLSDSGLPAGTGAPVTTRYVNTIPATQERLYPGDEEMEKRLRAAIRWNAVVMVDRANRTNPGLGGHLSTFASAASLYTVGMHHFWGVHDQVFIQGHAAPGIYARAFLEGRLSESDLDLFRRETLGGLPSYPHPRRMPGFWQFPTVSMGLGPLNAIHQARMNRYLHSQGLKDTSQSRVWCMAGDGEMDEPESTSSLSLASREGLDNLVMVVNCNLQRLDGPVRGGGKVIQELEARFRGAGWRVLKVVWGRDWDPLLEADVSGELVRRMETVVDGDYQRYVTGGGAHMREHFFNTPYLRSLVEGYSDRDLELLTRGGHDVVKLHSAYAAACESSGQPTVILTKTVKGWTLGESIEGRNATHQMKTVKDDAMRELAERIGVPVVWGENDPPPYYNPGPASPEVRYLHEKRAALGGLVPSRTVGVHSFSFSKSPFTALEEGSGVKPASTTGALSRLVKGLMEDGVDGARVVPIVCDEARTFGLDPVFSRHGVYAPNTVTYEGVDAGLALVYKESPDGRMLQEGISEAAALADFTALATSYSTWGQATIPFYLFYSMFGFQRVGDAIWAAADARARGFLCGATAGRTTLEGEGLQHCDGHSLLLASSNPAVRSYDCAFAYELASVVRSGIKEMEVRDYLYYLTVYNENYVQPPRPEIANLDKAIARGAYLLSPRAGAVARIAASGPMVRTALEAQGVLDGFGVPVEVWSVTSFTELRREALAVERFNARRGASEVPYVTRCFGGLPVVAVSDWMRAVPELVSRFTGPMLPLGTDGWGLSDTREALREFFGVDSKSVVSAVFSSLGVVPPARFGS